MSQRHADYDGLGRLLRMSWLRHRTQTLDQTMIDMYYLLLCLGTTGSQEHIVTIRIIYGVGLFTIVISSKIRTAEFA